MMRSGSFTTFKNKKEEVVPSAMVILWLIYKI
jgi:hypothetical protein